MDYKNVDNSHVAPKKENICAVVVTFFPDRSFVERVNTIRGLVASLVIVDNSTGENLWPALAELPSSSMIKIIQNKKNLGVATAFNLGVREAKQKKYHWVLLLDQDSSPIPSVIDTFTGIYKEVHDESRLGIIGSKFVDYETSVSVEKSSGWERKTSVITSGSLISMSVFDDIGYFMDDLFIDLVDHEYCLRMKGSGYLIAQTKHPVMKHSIGSFSLHKLICRTFRASNHSVGRHYYMVRNYIVIFRKYILLSPFFVVFLLYVRIRELLLVILFEEKKLLKLRAMALGLWHGCRGRLGKFDSPLGEL